LLRYFKEFCSGIFLSLVAMSSGSPIRHHSDAEEEDSPLQQSVEGEHLAIADLEAEDNMS
jgi:hypothetical protein